MSFATFMLKFYRWHALSDSSLLEMKKRVDKLCAGAHEIATTNDGIPGIICRKDLPKFIQASEEICAEMQKRGLV